MRVFTNLQGTVQGKAEWEDLNDSIKNVRKINEEVQKNSKQLLDLAEGFNLFQ